MKKLTPVFLELKNHAPFTLFGASTGILCMLIFRNLDSHTNLRLFQIFHPTHVVLSAMVTSSLFLIYKKKTSLLTLFIVGYFGSIGIATLSDSVLPFFGETIFGVAVPTHEAQHESRVTDENDPEPATTHEHDGHGLHLGFIEEWYIVNPAAFLGIFIAYFMSSTKFPHAGHVLISTWASSFHVLMNTQREMTALMLAGFFVVLFIAVWLPCCISDIVFPMLFINSDDFKPLHHH
ncbi:MAG: hypothetical protein P8016_10790 [Sedimentisphaerales bacterium]